jgi:CBS domain-containing protein
MPTVAEIMDSQPVTVSPDEDVQSVLAKMQDNELPGVPVVDSEGLCVGIITESDLILRDEEADLHLPHYIQIMGGIIWLESLRKFEARARKALASKASEMMTSEDLTTVAPDVPAEEAGRLIAEKGHNRIPVLDSDGKLVGVVTRVDVLGALTG